MAVFYGAVVALGQMLHCLPGLGHGDLCHSGPSLATACGCCHTTGQPLSDGHTEQTADGHSAAELVASTPSADGSCPVCDLLGLAQAPATAPSAVFNSALASNVRFPAVRPPRAEPFEPYLARGPPADQCSPA